MANYCHQCSQRVATHMRACPNCGTDLRGAAPGGATATSAPPRPDFGEYSPRPRGGMRPSASSTGYTKASVGARFVASLLDGLVGILAMAPGGIVLAIGAAADEKGTAAIGGVAFVVGLGWALWYAFTKDGRGNGQSIGKRRMGLMVVHLPSNSPCTPGQSAMRELIMIVCNLVPAVGWLIEPVIVLVAEDGRRLGDRAADTQVIPVGDYAAAA